MDRGSKYEYIRTGEGNRENDPIVDSKEMRLDIASSLHISLDILPLEEELIERVAAAKRENDLKLGAAEAELLALRLEMEYTASSIEADELDLNGVAKMIAKMKGNLDELLQERRFEVILWSLDGLEDMLKHFLRDRGGDS